jgi:hypothetical protein
MIALKVDDVLCILVASNLTVHACALVLARENVHPALRSVHAGIALLKDYLQRVVEDIDSAGMSALPLTPSFLQCIVWLTSSFVLEYVLQSNVVMTLRNVDVI